MHVWALAGEKAAPLKVKVDMTSFGVKPEPVTMTEEPTAFWVGDSVMAGKVIVNVADAESGGEEESSAKTV